MNKPTSDSTDATVSTQQPADTLHLQMERRLDQIERYLDENPGGGSNPNAVQEIKRFGFALKRSSPIFCEKVDSLIHYAEILYSPRKHARWNSAFLSGPEAVAGFMRHDLVSIRTILWRMNNCP